jgi:flagellar biosynthesis/type III secretory pathway chaperone
MMPVGDAHIERAEALLALLRREYDALLIGDLAAIEGITRDKHTALAAFEELRCALPAAAGDASGESGRRFAALARECRRQNEINGGMIEASLRHTQSLLRVLCGQPQDDALYSARGGSAGPTTPGRPLASA